MRIFIEGIASVSAAGDNGEMTGGAYRSGLPTWQLDDLTGLPVYRAGGPRLDPKVATFLEKRDNDRATALALHAANGAVQTAGWQDKDFAILVGCSRGPTASWEMEYDHFLEEGRARTRTSPTTTLGGIGFALGNYFEKSALATSLSVTCSSGFHALLHGVALLESGMAERVLVGGAEAPLTPFTLAQMKALRIYAKQPKVGQHACRPFEAPHSGMVIGEGAAFVALTKADTGQAPFISGLGFAREQTTSATSISREGLGLQRAMRGALEQAGEAPDLIVAHAPGTKRGDAAERHAITQVFGEAALQNVVSGKWATGHTFGASGPLGLDLAAEYLGAAAGTMLGGKPLPTKVRSALINATGFGGNAVSVMVNHGLPG